VRHRPATPVVVIHGGGWSAGERSEVVHTDAWLAAEGFAVFDVDYRLVPATAGAGALADVRCALAWIRDKANSEGFDIALDRTVLLGRSAGGHLALLTAYTAHEPTQHTGPCDTTGVNIAGVVALYPVTDLASAYAAPANRAAYPLDDKIRAFAGGTPESHQLAYQALSPLAHVTRETPPTLLIHGARDQVVPFSQSRRLAESLAAHAVAHDLLVLPWAGHGFDFVIDGPADQLTKAITLQFLRELPLVGRPAPAASTPRR
jgi:acetyl esterase/lipase